MTIKYLHRKLKNKPFAEYVTIAKSLVAGAGIGAAITNWAKGGSMMDALKMVIESVMGIF